MLRNLRVILDSILTTYNFLTFGWPSELIVTSCLLLIGIPFAVISISLPLTANDLESKLGEGEPSVIVPSSVSDILAKE